MRGGSLTRFRTDEWYDQHGKGLVTDLVRGGLQGLKRTRNPLKLPSHILSGLETGLSRGVKRKAEDVIKKEITKQAKKALSNKNVKEAVRVASALFPKQTKHKLLVPGIEIKMKFHFNGPNLFLNRVGEAGRLVEGDVKLRFHLCQLRLNEAVYSSLSAQRHNEGQIATYPTVRSEIRTFSMQGNLVRFDIPNLFQNRVPDRLIVGLVDRRAFNGNVTRDPFCFQKFGLTSINQIVKGEEYPYETLHLVRNNGTRDNLGYFRFLQASGAWCKKKGNMVELEDWGHEKNCTLFMFDNVANGCADSQRLNPKQTGDLQLSLEFGAAPNTNITVLVYGEFENLLEIDKNGAVLYNIYQH